MEVEGKIIEIPGTDKGIKVMQRNQGDGMEDNASLRKIEDGVGENMLDKETVITDPKRRRITDKNIMEDNLKDLSNGPMKITGP